MLLRDPRNVRQGLKAEDYAELGVGIIVDTDGLTAIDDYIVMWGHHGVGWEFPGRLEVVNESR